MTFDIKGKVALITGAASGIGLKYAKELLKNGLKGVTILDLNKDFGKQALDEIQKEFGPNKAIFWELDVTDTTKLKELFKKAAEYWKSLDIVITNAGVLNDKIWEKEIQINITAVVHSILVSLELLPKYRSGNEGIIVNIASVAALHNFPNIPVYCGTKAAVLAISRAFGHPLHYERTKVRVITVCPGVTNTPLIGDINDRSLGPEYEALLEYSFTGLPEQEAEHVAKCVVKMIKEAPTATTWVAEGGKEPYQYYVSDRRTYSHLNEY